MLTVNLPELVAGRDMAAEIVAKLGPLAGQTVLLDCGRLVNGTVSFAAAIVEQVLGAEPTARLVVRGGPSRFREYLERAAGQLRVSDRLTGEDVAGFGAGRRGVG